LRFKLFSACFETAGLPDGIFSNKNPNLGKFWRATENVDLVYGHLKYITVIWFILRPFGNFVAILVYFPRFGIV
jgi:hypothetical protein